MDSACRSMFRVWSSRIAHDTRHAHATHTRQDKRRRDRCDTDRRPRSRRPGTPRITRRRSSIRISRKCSHIEPKCTYEQKTRDQSLVALSPSRTSPWVRAFGCVTLNAVVEHKGRTRVSRADPLQHFVQYTTEIKGTHRATHTAKQKTKVKYRSLVALAHLDSPRIARHRSSSTRCVDSSSSLGSSRANGRRPRSPSSRRGRRPRA